MGMAVLLYGGIVVAQIPVEFFVGNKKATADVMFFKYIKDKKGQPSDFLFFNRNRASVDYKMTSTTYLPQFGCTEAISYNHKRLHGFAPVVVASILNKGIYPKVGIQFATIQKSYTVFSWVVAETLHDPNIDFFFLARYTPGISTHSKLFMQLELVNAFPTVAANSFVFTQRIRIGIKKEVLQFGAGIDLSQAGNKTFASAQNWGGFVRYEF